MDAQYRSFIRLDECCMIVSSSLLKSKRYICITVRALLK